MNPTRNYVKEISDNPKYQELLKKRGRISLTFFIITLVIYSSFILTLAFDPELFGRSVGNATISIGVVTATAVLISASILIGIYVYISNKIFDPLIQSVLDEVRYE